MAQKLVRRNVGWVKLALFVAALTLIAGCAGKAIYREAAESGWERWEADRRPILPDEEYIDLTPEEQKFYLPQSKVNTRIFERDQALGLLDE
jgi:Fe-S cluster biosynthesis and repair protein YggX